MSQQQALLEGLLRDNDLGWMIDLFAPREGALPFLVDQLRRVAAEYRSRFGAEVSFAPEALAAEAAQNPHKVRAFLQALGSTHSAAMLVMVWRILQGQSVREVTLNYRERDSFDLQVVLAPAGNGQDRLERYHSQDINDAALLRHFGIAMIDGRPLFDGFFPLRLRASGKAEKPADRAAGL